MFSKEIPQRQLWAWIISAMTAPLAVIAGKCSWLWVLAVGLVCSALCWSVFTLSEGKLQYKKWYCTLQLIWLTVVISEIARWTLYCWEDAGQSPVISLTLLILAAVSAWSGGERASRVGSVLSWLMAGIYIIVLAAGAGDLNVRWMRPEMDAPSPELVFVFLLPATVLFLPGKKTKGKYALGLAILFSVVITLCTAAILSPAAAKKLDFPFYTFSKSLSLFGVAERFESLVSVVLTLGFFSLLSFLISAIGSLAEQLGKGGGRTGIIGSAILAGILLLLHNGLSGFMLAVLSVIFWGIAPLTAVIFEKIKKSKNS